MIFGYFTAFLAIGMLAAADFVDDGCMCDDESDDLDEPEATGGTDGLGLLISSDPLEGTLEADHLVGDASDNSIYGFSGPDTIAGGDGRRLDLRWP